MRYNWDFEYNLVKNLSKDQDLSYRETVEEDLDRDLKEEIVSRLATKATGTYSRQMRSHSLRLLERGDMGYVCIKCVKEC